MSNVSKAYPEQFPSKEGIFQITEPLIFSLQLRL